MTSLCPTPDEKHGTIAETNGSLVSVESAHSAHMQNLGNATLYPSIEYESIGQITANYATFKRSELNILESTYNDILNVLQQQWEERRPAIEASPLYKRGRQVYDYVYNTYLKTPEATLEHPLFNSTNTDSIRSMAWHPHLDMVAVAHKDNGVYVYEKKGEMWTCQVLFHEKMKDITCIEWKLRASGTLAVGCRQGVCVWNLEGNATTTSVNDSKPRYHPHAYMKYLTYPQQDYISSLAWDPTPGSHLLAVVSAVSNVLVIHDTLLDRTIPLKRYGKGNILLRWSPSGEWLFEGGSAGISRMWDTSDWSSQHIKNPPGLWIQAACWSPDNRTLIYSMCGKSDIHALFLSGKSIKSNILDLKIVSTPTTTVTTDSGESVSVGGIIRDIAIDQSKGERVVIAYEKSPLLALYSLKRVSPLDIRQDDMLFPIGYIRGAKVTYHGGSLDIAPLGNSIPLSVRFSSIYKNGAILAVAWNDGTISFVTHTFINNDELHNRFS